MLSGIKKLFQSSEDESSPFTIFDLQRLASTATPGPWKYDDGMVMITEAYGFSSIPTRHCSNGRDTDRDGQYIAAASPGIICELIARLLCLELSLDQISVLVDDPDIRSHIDHFKSLYGAKVPLRP